MMKWVTYIFALLIFVGCKPKSEQAESQYSIYDLDQVNSHDIYLHAESNAVYLLEQAKEVFSFKFPESNLNISYMNDQDVMQSIYQDSVRLIVQMRDFTDYEVSKIQSIYESKVIQHTFAYDAICLVKDAESTDTLIDASTLNELIHGDDQIFVTTQENASLFHLFLVNNGVQNADRSLHVVKSLADLQQYLANNPVYIGLLPFSMVGNQYSQEVKDIISMFTWMGVLKRDETVHPSQSTIYTREWPLVIPYNILYCRLPSYKGVGFVKFLHTRQAAKLILKAGLIPEKMPSRAIQLVE